MVQRILELTMCGVLALAISGCAVVTVAGAVVGVAATVVETGVAVGGAVVRTTAKGVEKAVDALSGDSDEAAKAAGKKPD